MSEAEATDPAHWANHLRNTVRFADAVDTLQEDENTCSYWKPGPEAMFWQHLARMAVRRHPSQPGLYAGLEKMKHITE